MSIWDRW